MTAPTIHSNGTSRAELARGYSEAYYALKTAYNALKATAPNGRDYYVQGPEEMQAATEEHMDRMRRVFTVMEEMKELALHCDAD